MGSYAFLDVPPDHHAPRAALRHHDVTGQGNDGGADHQSYVPDEIETACALCTLEWRDGRFRHERSCLLRDAPLGRRCGLADVPITAATLAAEAKREVVRSQRERLALIRARAERARREDEARAAQALWRRGLGPHPDAEVSARLAEVEAARAAARRGNDGPSAS